MPPPNIDKPARWFSAAAVLHGGSRALVWACGHLSRLVLGRTVVALAIVVASFTITTYALWIGAILWIATGRFGIFRSEHRRVQIERGVALASIVALVALSASEGRPAANLVFIAVCALGGALLWFNRGEALGALRAEAARTAGFDRAASPVISRNRGKG